jgi:hypothetical protein
MQKRAANATRGLVITTNCFTMTQNLNCLELAVKTGGLIDLDKLILRSNAFAKEIIKSLLSFTTNGDMSPM